jgi:RNA recognition motif-containing protein
MNIKLFVGNLRWSITDDLLRQYFSQVGKVRMATVILDRNTGRSRGFGFVEMQSEEEAQKAIQMFNGEYLEGRPLIIKVANPEGKERNQPTNNLDKFLADFITRDAKVDSSLGFSVGKKHFTITRDDQETDFNHSR